MKSSSKNKESQDEFERYMFEQGFLYYDENNQLRQNPECVYGYSELLRQFGAKQAVIKANRRK